MLFLPVVAVIGRRDHHAPVQRRVGQVVPTLGADPTLEGDVAQGMPKREATSDTPVRLPAPVGSEIAEQRGKPNWGVKGMARPSRARRALGSGDSVECETVRSLAHGAS